MMLGSNAIASTATAAHVTTAVTIVLPSIGLDIAGEILNFGATQSLGQASGRRKVIRSQASIDTSSNSGRTLVLSPPMYNKEAS